MSSPDRPSDAAPDKQLGLAMPLPLSARLDGLVALAGQAGVRTSRRRLLAALIKGAPFDPEELARGIRNLRRATVRDCLIEGQNPAVYLDPPRTRGPRDRHQKALLLSLPPSAQPSAELDRKIDELPQVLFSLGVSHEIDALLNECVTILTANAERTTRREVVEALVLAADTTPSTLAELLEGRTVEPPKPTTPRKPGRRELDRPPARRKS